MMQSQRHWDSIAKPLGMSWKTGTGDYADCGEFRGLRNVQISKKGLVIMCAAQRCCSGGGYRSGQDVTAAVAENFLDEKSCVAIMCRQAHAGIFPVGYRNGGGYSQG